MEPPTKKATTYNLDLCWVCQHDLKDPKVKHRKSLPLTEVTYFDDLEEQYKKWKRKIDCPDNILKGISVLYEYFRSGDKGTLKWHRHKCRPLFMSSEKLLRYPDMVTIDPNDMKVEDIDHQHSVPVSDRITRSMVPKFDKDTMCVLCCTGIEGGELHLASTFNKHEELYTMALSNPMLMIRLENAIDVIAGDIHYHRVCLLHNHDDQNNEIKPKSKLNDVYNVVYNPLCQDIKARTSRGQAVLVSDSWERFKDLCVEHKRKIPHYFKLRRKFFINKLTSLMPNITEVKRHEDGDYILISSTLSYDDFNNVINDEDDHELKLPAYSDNEMLHSVHSALRLRKLILDLIGNVVTKANLSEESANECIPEDLYIFILILCGGQNVFDVDESSDEDEDENPVKSKAEKKAEECRQKVLNICQDIVYIVSGGKIIPPKQYAVSMAVHTMTRNTKLQQLLHKACSLLSHKKCLQGDNAVANEVIRNIDEQTGTVIPNNLVHGRTVRFAKDNIDADKESAIAGHSSGYHATQIVCFQPGPIVEIDVSTMKFDTKTPEVPEALHRLILLDTPIKKNPPWSLTIEQVDKILDVENSTGSQEYRTAQAYNMAFLFYREKTDQTNDKKADWTEFNKYVYRDRVKPASIIGQIPLLNAKANQHDTINTAVERGRYIAQQIGEDHVWFTNDQDIFAPSEETKWTRGEPWDHVHFRLGGLHSCNMAMSTIGDHIAGSEIPEMWVNAGIVTEGVANKIMMGKDFKAGLRLHKITYQASWKFLLTQLMTFIQKK